MSTNDLSSIEPTLQAEARADESAQAAADDPEQTKRILIGGLAGAGAALVCFCFMTVIIRGGASGVLIMHEIGLGICGGFVGSTARSVRQAITRGSLAALLLPVFIFFMLYTASPAALFAMWIALGSLGGLCGLVGHVVVRSLPQGRRGKFALQFTIRELLCVSFLVALFFGMLSYALRSLWPK